MLRWLSLVSYVCATVTLVFTSARGESLSSPTCIQLIRTNSKVVLNQLSVLFLNPLLSWDDWMFSEHLFSLFRLFRKCRVRRRCIRGGCGGCSGKTQAQRERQSPAGSPGICRCSPHHPQGKRFILYLQRLSMFLCLLSVIYKRHSYCISLCWLFILYLPL